MKIILHLQSKTNNMEFILNKSARETTINKLVDEQVNLIKKCLERGQETIDLYIDNEYASDVRDKLQVILDGKFTFCIVRTNHNQYTGKIQHFTGETIGDERHYKIRYIGK